MDSFIRWQSKTMAQFSFVNNLLIGLSSGMLMFELRLFLEYGSCSLILSILLYVVSILIGCFIAYNRLCSFRLTERIARIRENDSNKKCLQNLQEDCSLLRTKTDQLDSRTWFLLPFQIISFVLGVVFIAVFMILEI